jgi:hypothetical protein
MDGKAILFVVAAMGLMVASVLAFLLVASCSFFGIALIGLLIWFTCTRVELEKDSAGTSPSLIARQYEVRQNMSQSERDSYRQEQSLAMQSVRFFRYLGIGLTLIGGVGFAWFQI